VDEPDFNEKVTTIPNPVESSTAALLQEESSDETLLTVPHTPHKTLLELLSS